MPDCFEILLMNPDFLHEEGGIQQVIAAHLERDRKTREWDRNNRRPGGGSNEPERRVDRGDRELERDRGGADLTPADRSLERGRRIKLP